ncbi:MAG: molybdenum cofactor biosynthesis protein MoaE [Campylobacterales bacterium]|nr:molybdenum cofactor biosynthesis protein MoaE [Campylobacterales bacterium]
MFKRNEEIVSSKCSSKVRVENEKRTLLLFDGSLPVEEITNNWYKEFKNSNYGAIITFVGVVRDEDGIDGLSFDLYEPILNSWFDAWQEKAKALNAKVLMAHSRGDVMNHTSSYIAAVCSPKRRVALELIDEFVEDFKASAPIWKYDIINGKREYALDRSTKIQGAGILK